MASRARDRGRKYLSGAEKLKRKKQRDEYIKQQTNNILRPRKIFEPARQKVTPALLLDRGEPSKLHGASRGTSPRGGDDDHAIREQEVYVCGYRRFLLLRLTIFFERYTYVKSFPPQLN